MLTDFWIFYFPVLLYNLMVYLSLVHSYKSKMNKCNIYILAFICANLLPLTDTLAAILVGGGKIPYTVSVFWILKICQVLQEIIKVIFIVYLARRHWFKYYWWGILLQFTIGIIYIVVYDLKFVTSVDGKILITPIDINTLPDYIMALVFIVLFGLLCILISRFFIRKIRFNYLSKWVWFSIYTVWGGIVFMSDKSYGDVSADILSRMGNIKQLAGFIVLAIIVLFISVNHSERKVLQIENRLLKQQNEIQYTNYLTLQQHDVNIHKLYHDIGNHLSTIRVLLEDGDNIEARKYAENLMNKYRNIKRQYYSDNKIINAVLVSKADVLVEKNIAYNIEICVPEELTIKDIDIMSVFSNLIDNAIENCSKVEVSNRYINIKSATIKNYLTINITNSKSNNSIQDNKEFVTWKEDKKLHGYGLKIIQEIKEKYEGDMQCKDYGDYFTAMVMLKI